MDQTQAKPQASEDGSIQWETATSAKGASFEVGALKSDETKGSSAAEADDDLVSANSNKVVKVSWPVTGDVWKDTEGEVASTITRYSLHINRGSLLWDWKLEFTNAVNATFKFVDDTGDEYEVTTHTVGDHYVRYNSGQPAIKAVRY